MKKLLPVLLIFLITFSCRRKEDAPIAVDSISLSSPLLTMKVDDAFTLNAVITPENAANKSIEWSSSNDSVATVSQGGEVKAIKEGEATIIAKPKANPNSRVAACKVAVSPKVPITRIALDPATASVLLNDPLQIVHSLTPANATESLNWTSSDTKLATVSSTGLVTGKALGQATITATASYSKIKTACQITITDKPVPIDRISFFSLILTLKMGESAVLAPIISPTNATNRKLRFSSDRPDIVSVSDKGVVTAIAKGEAVITVTTDDGGKRATCTVMVDAVVVTGVSLSPTLLTLPVGQTRQLQESVEPANATNKTVAWSSSAESIATVSATGVVRAIASGEATITIATADGNRTASCTVTVVIPVSTIALTPNPTAVAEGSRMQLRVVVTPENASNKTVTWRSSDEGKATVDKDGWVTGVARGAVTITATAADGSTVKGEVALTVKNKDATVSAITLGPEKFSVVVPVEGMTTTLANAPRAISSNLAAVSVSIVAIAGATIKIGEVTFVQGQAVNFTNPVTFTVTMEDGTTVKNYSVSIPAYNAAANPYGIYTVKDLADVKNGLSESFLLKNVIALPSANAEGATATGISDYGAAGWLPLGPFTGTFDGGNLSITNFYANRTAENVGLFGKLGSGGTIKNLGVTGIIGTTETNSSTGRTNGGVHQFAGLLVGHSAGTIDKCYATGNVHSSSSSSDAYAGGLAGLSEGAISHSHATGSVFASSSASSGAYAGGLVGLSVGSIRNSYATGGSISSTATATALYSYAYAGGLVGYITNSSISNSYAEGGVSSSSSSVSSDHDASAGGLVGYASSSSISNSYATGSASSSAYAGGLVGSNESSISNSYATGNVSDAAYAGGLVGYTSKSSSIRNSYATGDVSSSPYFSPSSAWAGGLVGYNMSSISNSYATGNVSSTSSTSSFPAYAGGLVGLDNNGSYTNCYRNSNAIIKNNNNTTVTDASIASILAKPKAEMQADAFTTLLNRGASVWGRGIGKNDNLPFIRGVGVGR